MLYSKPTLYAIRALVTLAGQPDQRLTSADIAAAESIPRPYLTKVLSTLTSRGFVTATRGPNGGFTLRTDPDKIQLSQIADLFDARDSLERCTFENHRLGKGLDCELCREWNKLSAQLRMFFERTTIAALSRNMRRAASEPDNNFLH